MKTRKSELIRAVGVTAILLMLGTGVMLYCEWRGNFWDTLYACQIMFWAMPVFAVLICLVHYAEGKGLESREYIGRIFRGQKRGYDRKAYLDYARILAAVMVILTHACSMQLGEDAPMWRIHLLTVCAGIGLVANPLYVMISGALLLASKKEESTGAFYYRRFLKIVIPMVVYYVIFLCVSGQMSLIPPRNIGGGIGQILAGASGIVPHYWLIYTLISLYIAAPFIRNLAGKLKDRHINILFGIILAEQILVTFLPLLGVQIALAVNFISWTGVFILGYIILERSSRIMEGLVILFGGVSAFIISFVVLHDYSLKDYVSNTAPTMVLFAGAILILLKKMEGILKNKLINIIQILSHYSYSIILVHWYGLFVVTWGKIGIQPLRFGCVGGIILTVCVTLAVCFILGFTADNTVVMAVQHAFKRLGGLARKIISLHKNKN